MALKRIITIIFVISILPTLVYNSTIRKKMFTCPIDNHQFMEYMQMSGSVFGRMLDFKPAGAIIAPWPLPQCNKCGFVLFKQKFTKKEIENLKKIVYSELFKKEWKYNTDYYSLARIFEQQGKDPVTLANTFLKATWQARNNVKYSQYAMLCISYIKRIPKEETKNNQNKVGDYIIFRYLLIELNRRMGRFEKAKLYIKQFPKKLNEKELFLTDLIIFQQKLIKAKDKKQKLMPKKKKE